MKRILLLLLLLGAFTGALACIIEVKADPSTKKDHYKAGDEVVVLVVVKKEHRVCHSPIEETTYEPQGLKILSATDWKETAPGVWERKMKLKVTDPLGGPLSFGVRRKCNKENSHSTLILNER
ncbi:MAG TPA: hypothetical protein VGE66_00500 [Chitinophagaceae bacterium]